MIKNNDSKTDAFVNYGNKNDRIFCIMVVLTARSTDKVGSKFWTIKGGCINIKSTYKKSLTIFEW